MSHDAIQSLLKESRRFEPPSSFVEQARIRTREHYDRLYRESLDDPEAFWRRESSELVFRTPWKATSEWKLPHAKWFLGATLNVTESCLDRHLTTPRKDSELVGLVYSLTDRPREETIRWYLRPATLAIIVLGMTLLLNIVFY